MTTNKRKIFRLPFLFFLIFFAGLTESFAQTPGGVTGVNVAFWLKGDLVNGSYTMPIAGSLLGSWTDVSGSGRHFYAPVSSAKPRFMYAKPMNFNPGVSFDQAASRLIYDGSYMDRGNSYYLFYVSRETKTKKDRSVVFNFIDYYDYNSTGWLEGQPYFRTNNVTYDKHGSVKAHEYAITGVIRPSINPYGATPSQHQQFYIDGVLSTEAPRALSDDVGRKGLYNVIGSGNNGTGNAFYGDIQEIIMLQGSPDTQLSQENAAKINSYLAIKYGISQQGNVNYLNSSGTVVWNKSTNSGYNNYIFGIANDPASGLNQRQSTSTEKQVMTVYVGPSVTTLNNDNQGYLPTNTYLLFGSNGLRGYAPYVVSSKNGFLNGASLASVEGNFKQNIVYKANLTGSSSQTVNIQTHMAATYILVSNSPSFTPTSTYLYPTTNGLATNVAITNNSYIGFLTASTAPGGVSGDLNLWLNATNTSSVVTSGTTNVQQWKDHLDPNNKHWEYVYNSTSEYKQNSKQPQFIEYPIEMNFHPAVDFRPEFNSKDPENFKLSYLRQAGSSVMSKASPDEYTFVSSLYSRFGNVEDSEVFGGYIMGFGSNNYIPKDDKTGQASTRKPTFGMAKDKSGNGVGRYYEGVWADWGLGVEGNGNLFHPNSTTISLMGVSTKRSNRYVDFGFDGHHVTGSAGTKTSNATISGNLGTGSAMNTKSTLGGGSYAARNYDGLMGEVIAYERLLSEAEKAKLYSYLSLKYATTLDINNNKFDYTLANGTPIWQGRTSIEREFHNNVAALVRDDISELNNMQARSTGNNAIVHMGIGSTLGSNPDLSGFSSDKQALVWGHNGINNIITLDPNDPDICGKLDFRMGKTWLVRKTGTETPEVILAAYGQYFGFQSADVFIMIADSKEKIANNKWDQIIPMIYDVNTGMHQINYTFTNERTYFTFGIKGDATTCEGCSISKAKKVDFSKWVKGYKSGTLPVNDELKAVITVTDPSKVLRTGYPRKHSGTKSLRIYRKSSPNATITTKIAFQHAKSTATSAATAEFYIYDIDYVRGNYDVVTVYGTCNGKIVYPQLEAGRGAKTYTIEKNVISARKVSTNYANAKGRVSVKFDTPVEEITIEYSGKGAMNISRWIGIGPMTLSCSKQTPPAPPLDEEGMSLTKEVKPTEVELCEEVEYIYRIFNSHCDNRVVSFSDELPEGLIWIGESLELDGDNAAHATVNAYADTRKITINNLSLAAGGEYKFSIAAKFKEDAVAGIYKNRAEVLYNRVIGGELQEVVLPSQNYWDPQQDSTVLVALATPIRLKNLELKEAVSLVSCYSANSAVQFSVTINNPNTSTVSGAALNLIFNEEFSYFANSLKSSTLTFSSIVADSGEGFLEAVTDIPPGQHTFVFSVIAPNSDKLIQDQMDDGTGNFIPAVDTQGRPIYIPLDLEFEMYSSDDDSSVCVDAVFNKINGAMYVNYCSYGDYIITNKNVTLKLR